MHVSNGRAERCHCDVSTSPHTAALWQELEARLRVDAAPARQELLQLCEGMRWLRLPVATNAEARGLAPACSHPDIRSQGTCSGSG